MNAVEVGPVRVGLRGLCLSLLVMVAGFLLSPSLWAQNAQGTSASPASAGLPASIPVKREQTGGLSGSGGDYGWLSIGIGVVLLGIGVVAMRKRSRSADSPGTGWRRLQNLLDLGPSPEISRSSSTRLSPRHSLHVVEWNGRRLLLGCSDQSIQLLAEAPSDPAATTVMAPDAQSASRAAP